MAAKKTARKSSMAERSRTMAAKKTARKKSSKKSAKLAPKKKGRPKKVKIDEASLTPDQRKRRSEMFAAWAALEKERESLQEAAHANDRAINETLAKIEKDWGNGPFAIGGEEHFITSKLGRYFLRKRSTAKAPQVL